MSRKYFLRPDQGHSDFMVVWEEDSEFGEQIIGQYPQVEQLVDVVRGKGVSIAEGS